MTHERRLVATSEATCADCIALGCNLGLGEACDCDCHEATEAARAMDLRLVRDETDSGGDPRPRLYP